MGKPEPLDMQAILDQQVKLAVSMERLQEAIGPVADAIRRGMTYDLVRNKRVQITANDRVEMYAGKDAEAIAIRVDHNLAAGDFTYWVGGRAYTALSYAYNHSNATPDEIVIPLDERGDKIEFSSTVTGVLTYTGLTLQQALPKMLTQLAVVRAVGIVGAGATPADPVYAELTGRNVRRATYLSNDIGSLNSVTLALTAGSKTVAAGTTYYTPVHSVDGNGTVGGVGISSSVSASVNWTTKFSFQVGVSTGYITGSISGNNITIAGQQTSVTAQTSVIAPGAFLLVNNADATNALTLEFASLYGIS